MAPVVPAGGQIIDLTQPDFDLSAEPTPGLNWGNLILGLMILGLAVVGGAFIWWREGLGSKFVTWRREPEIARTLRPAALPADWSALNAERPELAELLPALLEADPQTLQAVARLLADGHGSDMLQALSRLDLSLVEDVRKLGRRERELLWALSKRPNFFYHLHPPTLPAREARWSYTFGLGRITLLLFLVLYVTGALELFYYVPTADGANDSLRWLAHVIPYGWLIRNVHFWAGQLMVISVGLHMARVVFTGAYKRPRRLNWLIGLALLVLTGLLDFTGYVLRWDEGTSWALLVGTNLLREIPLIGQWLYGLAVGGPTVSSVTVLRFYGWHIFGLTLPALVLIAWHGWRVRRDGGISHVASCHAWTEPRWSGWRRSRRCSCWLSSSAWPSCSTRRLARRPI